MIREKYEINSTEYAAVFLNSRLDATRKRRSKKKGFRVYDNGLIGLKYTESDCDEDKMFRGAEEMLRYQVPYEPAPEEEKVCHMDMTEGEKEPDYKAFENQCEDLVIRLKKRFPGIIFSNSIRIVEEEHKLENTQGLDLSFKDRYYLGEINLKMRDGINISDGAIPYKSRTFEPDEIFAHAERVLANYENVITVEEGKTYPIIISTTDCFNVYYGFINTCFERELNGQHYGAGGSLLCGQQGKQVFSKDFNLIQYSDPVKYIGRPFFDAEGTIIDGGVVEFVKDGTFLRPYTDKSVSLKYGLENTGSAEAKPENVPCLGGIGGTGIPEIRPVGLTITGQHQALDTLVGEERAIYVFFSLAGSYNNIGGYALPIQFGMVYENGEFIGRTQELMCNTNIWDMYGKDYRGLAKNTLMPASAHDYMVIDMKANSNG
ncbi:metallopeptidase TldD-related protein [Emergencia sp. JLR.KK010]|uniref:metallopeptidase TldD-related protein n=1 Tax=Emergencia sp. JLR.KK010 TaxID=3114296 RepID=UPI0030D47692